MVEVLRRDFAPFTSSTPKAFQGERAGKQGTAEGWRVGAKYVVRGHTTQTVLKEYRTSARLMSLEFLHLAEGAQDQSFSVRQGLPSVQGRSSRASSPASSCPCVG